MRRRRARRRRVCERFKAGILFSTRRKTGQHSSSPAREQEKEIQAQLHGRGGDEDEDEDEDEEEEEERGTRRMINFPRVPHWWPGLQVKSNPDFPKKNKLRYILERTNFHNLFP